MAIRKYVKLHVTYICDTQYIFIGQYCSGSASMDDKLCEYEWMT